MDSCGEMTIPISVIVLSYFDTPLCIETLSSLSTKVPGIEVILLDCNPDPDPGLSDYFLNTFNLRLIVHHFPESSIFQAMQFGLQKAKQDKIWFLNSGDTLIDFDIESMQLLLRDSQLLVGEALIVEEGRTPREWTRPDPRSWTFNFGFNSYCHQACIFSKEHLDIVGGFIDSPHADTVMIIKYVREFGVLPVNAFQVAYRAGGHSSQEALLSWTKNRLGARTQIREAVGWNIFGDLLVYTVYLVYRLTLNLSMSHKRRKWWTVGN